MYDIILFDLDDTLLDFTQSEHLSLNKIHQLFYDHTAFAEFKKIFQSINSQLWQKIAEKPGSIKPSEIRLRRFLELNKFFETNICHENVAENYEKHLGETADWLPEVKPAIQFLHNQGYTLGIVTNGLVSVQYKKYAIHNLEKWFKCFVVSDEVNVSKPDKAIFDIALSTILSQTNLSSIDKSRVLMVGDSLMADGRGSKNAGIDYCFIGNDDEKANMQTRDVNAKYKINSVNKLPNYLGHQQKYSLFLTD